MARAPVAARGDDGMESLRPQKTPSGGPEEVGAGRGSAKTEEERSGSATVRAEAGRPHGGMSKAAVEVLPGKRRQGLEDGVPDDLGRAAGFCEVVEGRAVAFEAEGAGLALEVRIGRQPVGDSEPGHGGGGQVSGVSLRACQGSSRSTCQMGRAVLQQTLAGLVRRVFCDHEGPVMGLGGDGCQGVVRGAKRVAMHGEVLGPALGPEPRDAVDEIVREDRQDCGTTDVIPGVGGEPRAARTVDVKVG